MSKTKERNRYALGQAGGSDASDTTMLSKYKNNPFEYWRRIDERMCKNASQEQLAQSSPKIEAYFKRFASLFENVANAGSWTNDDLLRTNDHDKVTGFLIVGFADLRYRMVPQSTRFFPEFNSLANALADLSLTSSVKGATFDCLMWVWTAKGPGNPLFVAFQDDSRSTTCRVYADGKWLDCKSTATGLMSLIHLRQPDCPECDMLGSPITEYSRSLAEELAAGRSIDEMLGGDGYLHSHSLITHMCQESPYQLIDGLTRAHAHNVRQHALQLEKTKASFEGRLDKQRRELESTNMVTKRQLELARAEAQKLREELAILREQVQAKAGVACVPAVSIPQRMASIFG